MVYINNIPHQEVLSLANQIELGSAQVNSKTLVQNKAVTLTLFAFAQGAGIGTHQSTGDAMVTVLEGTGQFTVEGREYLCKAGESLVMPAQKPHAVFAPQAFKMLLTVVFP